MIVQTPTRCPHLKAGWGRGRVTAANALADDTGNRRPMLTRTATSGQIDNHTLGYSPEWLLNACILSEFPMVAGEDLLNITKSGQSWMIFSHLSVASAGGGQANMFGQRDAQAATTGVSFMLNGNNTRFRFEWNDSGGTGRNIDSATAVPIAEKFTIVAARDAVADTFDLYVNGTIDATVADYSTNATIKEENVHAFAFGGRSDVSTSGFNAGFANLSKLVLALDLYLPPINEALPANKAAIAAWLHANRFSYLPESLWGTS